MKWWNVLFGFGGMPGWHGLKLTDESGRADVGTFEQTSFSDMDWDSCSGLNPASGLPMMDDCMDVAGNPFGTDLSDWHDMGMGLDDPFSTTDRFSDDLGDGIGGDW